MTLHKEKYYISLCLFLLKDNLKCAKMTQNRTGVFEGDIFAQTVAIGNGML